MFRFRYWRSLLADESWRYAIVGGLLALPFVARSYWETGMTAGIEPIFAAGLLVGYFFQGSVDEVGRVGSRTGVVGALPVLLWMSVEPVAYVLLETVPWYDPLVPIAVAVLFVTIGSLFAALVGAIGARIGDWLSEKVGRYRPPVVARWGLSVNSRSE
ncbi:DUF5518 domain-containing protein [Haloterrigena sp. SYSU A121-1]|uniref:DUF5518 domain-containing protein n=1 Tax=Haloterrigena gelatinilytica TaxID=2741724 RepID=A0A8J8KET5_9EURY|nr:DUF5518 domain-containing protein [Haloterrigena gelatinilytica]NUB90911.1 DUF5518 domain-containing protein [Haloterrigena gelatinilytica]